MNTKYVLVLLYLSFCIKLLCATEKNAKIMNGLIAQPKQYTFMVSLQIKHTSQHFCGGAIINSNHVLTAAHCMYLSIKNKDLLPASKLQVHAGTVNLMNDGIISRVSKVFIHDNYESRILDNDIAILRLVGKGFKFSSDIQPVHLSSGFIGPTKINDSFCTIIGWGRQCPSVKQQNDFIQKVNTNTSINVTDDFTTTIPKNESNKQEENQTNASVVETFITSATINECIEVNDYVLRYAEIPIQNSSECDKDYRDADITDDIICAGKRGSRIDSCMGDSGGPLICKGKLEGIVSFGDGCDNWNHLGVYTRVSKHLQWINKTINSNACNLKNTFIIYLLFISEFIFLLINK